MKLITFDSTGTLIRVRGSAGQIYAAVARSHGLDLDSESLNKAFFSAFKKISSQWPNFGYPSLPSKDWWRLTVTQAFHEAGCRSSNLEGVFEDLFRLFAGPKGWELFPETREVLASLRANGMKLGVISNFDERLSGILHCLGLDHYLDFILTSREAGCEKPSPEIFRQALSLAGVPAASALHVGDDETRDFEGARAAGVSALLLAREGSARFGLPNTLQDMKALATVSGLAAAVHPAMTASTS